MKKLIVAALVSILAGCALPESRVTTGALRPTIAVKGAPADAMLVVDGLFMGYAKLYDGAPKVLLVEEGVHQVELRQGSNVIHSEKVFISNGQTRMLNINLGTK